MNTRRGQEGVALVEFALAAPIFLFVLLAALQLAVIVMQDYSLRQVTRETARWLAIHPDNTDAAVLAHARAVAMAGMRSDGFTSVIATPACPALSGGRCSGRDSGSMVSVEIRYSLTRSLFLPTSFGLGSARVSFPTDLPPQRVSVMVE